MAGTGYAYEIVNRPEVIACLEEFASRVVASEARSWLLSRQFIKALTAPGYTIRLDPVRDREAIGRTLGAEEGSIRHLEEKLASGGDLRAFSIELFRRTGPDIGHLVDWLNALPTSDPRMIKKLSRVSVEAALEHARAWVSAKARLAVTALGSEKILIVLEPSPGKVWVELLNEAALLLESSAMSHCVDGYAHKLGCGTRILSLRNSVGKSLVTVEIIEAMGTRKVGQIKARSNAVPCRSVWSDIVELLNFLEVSDDLYDHLFNDTSRIGITRTPSGWALIIDVAERVEVFGVVGFGQGEAVHVISPDDFRTVIAVINGPRNWWRGNDGKSLVATPVGDCSKHTLAEQREVAKLMSEAEGKITSGGFKYLVLHQDKWTPWIDTVERWDLGTVEVLFRSGVIYLMTAHGDHIVAKIEKPNENDLMIASVINPERRLSQSASRRLVAALDALEVDYLDPASIRVCAEIKAKHGSRGWYFVPDHAVTRQASVAGLTGNWTVTPWHASLKVRGYEECSIALDSGIVLGVRLPILPNRRLIMEISRTLNALRLKAKQGRCAFLTSSASEEFRFASGRAEKFPYGVIFVDGRWRSVSSRKTFLKNNSRLIERGVCGKDYNDIALGWLMKLKGEDAEVDKALADHIGCWARGASVDDLRYRRLPLGWPRPRSDEVKNYLVEAPKLFNRMGAKDRKALITAARRFVKGIIGRTTRAKVLDWGRDDAVYEVVVAFREHFEATELARYAKWYLRGGREIVRQVDGCVDIDVAWHEIVAKANNRELRHLFASAVSSAFFRVRYRNEAITINSPDDARRWLDMIAMTRCHWDGASTQFVFRKVEEVVNGQTDSDWIGVRERIRDLAPEFTGDGELQVVAA